MAGVDPFASHLAFSVGSIGLVLESESHKYIQNQIECMAAAQQVRIP
jgi:hypothetical protein